MLCCSQKNYVSFVIFYLTKNRRNTTILTSVGTLVIMDNEVHKGGCCMKVSVDSFMGSARTISSQQKIGDSPAKKEQADRTDSVELEGRLVSRLDSIHRELRDVQQSLTKSQVIQEGLRLLNEDMQQGGTNQNEIVSTVVYDKKKVLLDFLEGKAQPYQFDELDAINRDAMSADISRIKKLQVETENILASKLGGSKKAADVMERIELSFDRLHADMLNSISRVNPDTVSRLIK